MLFMFITCQTEAAFRRDPLLRRTTSWTVLKAFNPSHVATGTSVLRGSILLFHTVMARAYSIVGTLTHRAPSECRRSSLHLPPSACRILVPDQTPQMTALSPKWDANKAIIRNV